jgi:hypothetical protein
VQGLLDIRIIGDVLETPGGCHLVHLLAEVGESFLVTRCSTTSV